MARLREETRDPVDAGDQRGAGAGVAERQELPGKLGHGAVQLGAGGSPRGSRPATLKRIAPQRLFHTAAARQPGWPKGWCVRPSSASIRPSPPQASALSGFLIRLGSRCAACVSPLRSRARQAGSAPVVGRSLFSTSGSSWGPPI